MVNSPTRNLSIDPEGTVRPLIPIPPSFGPTMAAGSGTGLTGAYQYKTSFIVTNSDGDLLIESPLSPPSASVTLANQNASLTDIAVSSDTISARRLYRTLTGGSSYFHLTDVDGNTATAQIENTPDATLELLPALSASLISPPGTLPTIKFKNIVEWKSRLWAVPDDPALIDTVYISETNKVYAWPNSVVAYPTGQDEQGIIGFAVRRNQLGLLKRNGLWQISGASSTTGISVSNVAISQIAFWKAGCLSPDTIISVNDKVYWLGRDGVYEWSDDGVQNISNDQTGPWFKSDTYFNRTRFQNAFARYNEVRNQYELHLAAAGSSSEDRWVSYDLTRKIWLGPHQTGAFTPTHAGYLTDSNGLPMTLVGGSDGVIYTGNSSTYKDGSATAIDYDVYTPFYSVDAPDIIHAWLELSMLSKIEAAGTLTITPYVGRLNASAGTSISHDLTTGRERLRRLGTGPLMRLRLRQNTVSQGCSPFGFEIPVFEVGRR